jgi:diacylglycerol kinase (ATP)
LASKSKSYRPLRAKLIFNTDAGRADQSPQQLTEILSEMQKNNIAAEVFIVNPEGGVDVKSVVRRAIQDGTKLIVVSGGDGTIDIVAAAMVGSPTTLGIIPTGTRNNLALNLGIPTRIADAVSILRAGVRTKIDVWRMTSNGVKRTFMEVASLGLISDMYPLADGVQHGDLSKLGELLSTFVSSTPTEVRLLLDGKERVMANAHMVVVTNMPYIGPNFQIDPKVSYKDQKLDVFVFSDMSKLNLVSFALRSGGAAADPSVDHFKVKRLRVSAKPAMALMVDGMQLEPGTLSVRLSSRKLNVMAGITRGEGPKKEAVPALKDTTNG